MARHRAVSTRASTPARSLLLASALFVGGATTVVAGGDADGTAFSMTVPVLMYHRISAPPSGAALPGLWVRPSDFRAQLRHLQRHGWQTVTAEEVARHLRAEEPLPPRTFVITIDDGARDGYTHAAPILRDLGMVATYYVTPGRAGLPWQLTWPMMREMQAAGNEIASHTLTHADLPTLGARALRRQIVGAQDLLERHLGERPITFCYPFGHHDRTVRQALRRAGIQLAFTTDWGAVHDARSPLRSPRIRVSGWDSPSAVLARIAPFSRVAPASSVPWARPPSVGTIHAA